MKEAHNLDVHSSNICKFMTYYIAHVLYLGVQRFLFTYLPPGVSGK